MTPDPLDTQDRVSGPPGDRLLPWRQVKALAGLSRTTAWRLQNSGDFPRAVAISPGRVAWRESEVSAWTARLAPRRAVLRPDGQAPQTPEPAATPEAAAAPSPAAAAARTPARTGRAAKRPRRGVVGGAEQMCFDF